MDENDMLFTQDLSGESDEGGVFTIQLFMKEKCPMPDR